MAPASPSSSKPESSGTSVTKGELAPWAEPAWQHSLSSPFYNDSHRRLQRWAREYIETHAMSQHLAWEAAGEAPADSRMNWVKSGLVFLDVPPPYRPKSLNTIAGTKWEDLDVFHGLILMDEMARMEGGVNSALAGAGAIGVPPIVNVGTPSQKQRWLPGLFSWQTNFCLGITEPSGGSDVSAIKTRAVKSGDGSSYTVTGSKKWITGAPWATHMTTAVRTGGPGIGGISLLVVPLKDPATGKAAAGVTVTRIANSGQNAGGASWVHLDNVVVPADHLLGVENRGFEIVMKNFNKERFILCVSANRKSRTCLATAHRYALERETFGQPLAANQLIRLKLTEMARQVEAHWAWLEQIAFHVGQHGWQAPDIASRIALAKVSAGKMLEQAAREAQQVLGGLGYQKGGFGGHVEQISRDLRMIVVGGGSEEIMGELAYREEVKRSRQLGWSSL